MERREGVGHTVTGWAGTKLKIVGPIAASNEFVEIPEVPETEASFHCSGGRHRSGPVSLRPVASITGSDD